MSNLWKKVNSKQIEQKIDDNIKKINNFNKYIINDFLKYGMKDWIIFENKNIWKEYNSINQLFWKYDKWIIINWTFFISKTDDILNLNYNIKTDINWIIWIEKEETKKDKGKNWTWNNVNESKKYIYKTYIFPIEKIVWNNLFNNFYIKSKWNFYYKWKCNFVSNKINWINWKILDLIYNWNYNFDCNYYIWSLIN